MKLSLNLLRKFIDLPSPEVSAIRQMLDDLGLEVKDLEEGPAGTVFNIETLANRGDHLYATGVAREISARLLTAVRHPALASNLPERPVSLAIRRNTDLCLTYAALELHNLNALQQRSDLSQYLESAGNHPLVDLLNYIALEIGQPMHAFDREKIEGDVIVETSTRPEKVLALDQKEYEVPAGSILIKDSKKILAVAGVIGCESSKVTSNTTKALIESATFDPVTVRKTAKAMKISTDASYAFERGVDLQGALAGIKRLINLIAADGVQVSGFSLQQTKQADAPVFRIGLGKIREQMNLLKLEALEISARLKHLGFSVDFEESGKTFQVQVPSWRVWDIDSADDLIEEIARSFSFSKIKLDLPPLTYDLPEPNYIERLLQHVEPSLVGKGFFEVITKGFYSQSDVNAIAVLSKGSSDNHLALKNAVDSNYSHLKISNLVHFARLAELNHRKGIQSVKIFELCRLFSKSKNKNGPYEYEADVLTFAASGRWNEHEWQKPEDRSEMISAFKAVVESVVAAVGHRLNVTPSQNPLLHPGCQATVLAGDQEVGFFGLMHPQLANELEIKQDLFYCELDAEKLSRLVHQNVFTEPSDFPSVKRDITVKLPPAEYAQSVSRFIESSNYPNLRSVAVFDDFKKADEDFRRVTYRMTFQSDQRTLESQEVDTIIQTILGDLQSKKSLGLV